MAMPIPSSVRLPASLADPVLYRIEYADGLQGTLLMLSGLVRDFTVALRIKGESEPLSTQMYLPGLSPRPDAARLLQPAGPPHRTMFLTGKASYPVERTLLTTGVLAAAIDSLHTRSEADRDARPPATCAIKPLANRPSGGADDDGFTESGPEHRAPTCRQVDRPRKKLAIVTTVWRYLSHAQHMGDRFLVGYPLARALAPARRWTSWPSTSIRSRRTTRARASPRVSASRSTRRFPRHCGAAAEKLAVDAVLIDRRARRLPAEREGPDPLSPVRVLPRGHPGLRDRRPGRAGLQ